MFYCMVYNAYNVTVTQAFTINSVFIAYVVCIMHGLNQGPQYQSMCVKGWRHSETG